MFVIVVFLCSDTAAVYHNEEAIGAALEELLPKYSLSREDIFITTKLCEYIMHSIIFRHRQSSMCFDKTMPLDQY